MGNISTVLRARISAYLLAVGLVALAFLISLAVWPVVNEAPPLLFVIAVLFSAWYGGRGPGLLCIVLAAIALNLRFIPPESVLSFTSDALLRIGVFILIAWSVSSLTAARKQAAEALEKAHAELEVRVQERTAELTLANSALARRAHQQEAVAALGQQALAGTDISQLMNEAVVSVARTLGVEHCLLLELLPGDKMLRLKAGVGWKEAWMGQAMAEVEARAPTRSLLLQQEPVLIEDLRAQDPPPVPSFVLEHGIVSGMSTAIRGYRPFGVLGAYSTRPHAFTREDLDFLQMVANILATAVDRAEGEAVLQGQTAAMVRTLNTLTSRSDLDTFFGQTLAALAEQLKTSTASLWLFDADDNRLVRHSDLNSITAASSDRAISFVPDAPSLPGTEPQWQEILHTRRPAIVGRDSRTQDAVHGEWWFGPGVQVSMLVPMLLGEDPIGLICIGFPGERPYRQEELEFAQALAQQATLAVQLTRLAQKAQETAVLQERNRIAREIHDNLAQGFTGIMIQLENAKQVLPEQPEEARSHIAKARSVARESLAEARRSVWALRPQALEDNSLPEAISGLLKQMTAGTSVKATCRVHGTPRPLPAEIEDNLLRIGQEALTNALRHAQPQTVVMELEFVPQEVRLIARDDGAGFDTRRLQKNGGLGVVSMRERTERIGGQLSIDSEPGHGTQVTVRVPLTQRAFGGILT